MRKYASSTPEAGELISELEFVRDNTATRHRLRSRQQQQQQYQQERVSQQKNQHQLNKEHIRKVSMTNAPADTHDDSQLRVLSPHSQQEPESYHDEDDAEEEDEAEEGEETFEEARDSFYEDDESDYGNYDSYYDNPTAGFQNLPMKVSNPVGGGGGGVLVNSKDQEAENTTRLTTYSLSRNFSGGGGDCGDGVNHDNPPHPGNSKPGKPGMPEQRWRRSVGHALNQITTELAAIREQMEAQTRADYHSRWRWRPKSVWSAVRYAASFMFSHFCWDMAILIAVLLIMRARGDKRLEEKLKEGWMRFKRKFPAVRFYIRQFRKFRFSAF
ncbi:hypothetical protein KEM54_001685 [Ascosphaera aggregata]|nr:hypothetical protein KEM54_001685 [Ascosphaera aggregata]